jgi:hypothetical protein
MVNTLRTAEESRVPAAMMSHESRPQVKLYVNLAIAHFLAPSAAGAGRHSEQHQSRAVNRSAERRRPHRGDASCSTGTFAHNAGRD